MLFARFLRENQPLATHRGGRARQSNVYAQAPGYRRCCLAGLRLEMERCEDPPLMRRSQRPAAECPVLPPPRRAHARGSFGGVQARSRRPPRHTVPSRGRELPPPPPPRPLDVKCAHSVPRGIHKALLNESKDDPLIDSVSSSNPNASCTTGEPLHRVAKRHASAAECDRSVTSTTKISRW